MNPIPENHRHQIAVVIITIGRDNLLRAVRSVFQQKFEGKIQVLIGVDIDKFQQIPQLRATLEQECPTHISLVWLDLGYSTSKRHGGVQECFYGGSLRTALSFLADAPFVTYLDDDDWFLPNHLEFVHYALSQYPKAKWAFTLSYYADPNSEEILCLDEIESVGVNKGAYREKFGGFVRPSGLTLNLIETLPYLHCWSQAFNARGEGEDRLMFDQLKFLPYCEITVGTVCCALDPKDGMHSERMKFIEHKLGRKVELAEKAQSLR
ncbi:glycosyltransferase [Haemophilus paracuniculus]|uniref:Glycosyltransferase n=1 Tax=Haemophilus paracuniculus TaxID=734 RepID=A0A1T0ARF3_9PAST|nr:glycosyltransferase family 2 protein [Haemophilus paracuniculus]OOR98927.1 glycosyltransferase [Haemophilus paracuniculus]